jgi:hypothetical protein
MNLTRPQVLAAMAGPARATLLEQLGDSEEALLMLAEAAATMRAVDAASLLDAVSPAVAARVLQQVQVRAVSDAMQQVAAKRLDRLRPAGFKRPCKLPMPSHYCVRSWNASAVDWIPERQRLPRSGLPQTKPIRSFE